MMLKCIELMLEFCLSVAASTTSLSFSYLYNTIAKNCCNQNYYQIYILFLRIESQYTQRDKLYTYPKLDLNFD